MCEAFFIQKMPTSMTGGGHFIYVVCLASTGNEIFLHFPCGIIFLLLYLHSNECEVWRRVVRANLSDKQYAEYYRWLREEQGYGW